MTSNFNPGFDREKASFLELANRGDGLTPIEYIYAENASFESLLASYLKGGMIDISMLYVIDIDAKDIITVTLEADIGTITTIYSENIYNKEKITTKDLFVSDNIYFGTSSKASKTLIYGDFQFYGGNFDIGSLSSPVKTVFIDSVGMEMAIATALSIDASFFTNIVGTQYSLTSPAINFNSTIFEVNFVERALKVGTVGIYSGGNIYLSAPLVKIGPATEAAFTKTLNFTVNTDLGCSISAGQTIDIIIKSLEPVGNETINIAGPNVVMEGAKKIDGSSDGSIKFITQETETNKKMGLQIINKTVEYPLGVISLDAEFIKVGRDNSYANTEHIYMTGTQDVWVSSGQRGSSASMMLSPRGALLSGLETSIGYLIPNSDVGECQHLVLQSSIDMTLSSKDIQIKNTDAIFGNLQPVVDFNTNTFKVNSIGSNITDRNTASMILESDHGITLNNKAPLTPMTITTTAQDINISTGSVANINVSSNNNVNIKAINLVELKSSTIELRSEEIYATSLMIPTPRFAQGEGVITPITGVGDCFFELFNIVICEAGVLKLADITVNITFA